MVRHGHTRYRVHVTTREGSGRGRGGAVGEQPPFLEAEKTDCVKDIEKWTGGMMHT